MSSPISLDEVASSAALDNYCPACDQEHVDLIDPMATFERQSDGQTYFLVVGRCSKCGSHIELGVTNWAIAKPE